MSQIIHQLKWRYAVKRFDSSKKLDDRQIDILKEAVSLSASSLGLQPYRVLLISDDKIKKDLLPHSYNQPQITDASHLFVFCAIKDVDEQYVNGYIDLLARERGQEREAMESYAQMVQSFLNQLSSEEKLVWASKQAYIALGTLLSACAMEGIDACPMEGFIPEEYVRVLELSGLQPLALVATGYRDADDSYAQMKKVRKAREQLFVEM